MVLTEYSDANYKLCISLRLETEPLFIPQLLLALNTLGVLIEIYQFDPSLETRSFYQRALAAYSELVLLLRGGGDDGHEMVTNKLLSVTEAPADAPSVKGRTAQELQASQLCCQLSLAEHKLNTGQVRTHYISLGEDSRH